jgi:cytochrome c peroxidase
MKRFLIVFGALIFVFLSCEKDKPNEFEGIAYQPTAYTLEYPQGWLKPSIPADNPMTVEGIELGRRLFYDPILSIDSTISCNSCHRLNGAMTDNQAISTGVKGRQGSRSAMSLVNLAFNNKGLFWDGRVKTLEEQALLPVEDHNEMADNWAMVEQKLRSHKDYPAYFRKAFGINKKEEITKFLAAKAIAQFERSIISKDSKYDRFKVNPTKYPFDDDELAGFEMFTNINENPTVIDAQCGHCHTAGSLITSNEYRNNGLQEANDYSDFKDTGYGATTGSKFDNGKMRIPTLRNISYSAPYMHNGNMKTIDEVMNHYISGGKYSITKDPLLQQIKLNGIQKRQVIKFLKTLDDSIFIKNPAYKNPFQ